MRLCYNFKACDTCNFSLGDQTYEADKNEALRSYAIPSNAIKVLSVACISHAETTALLSEKYASLLICALFPTIKSCRYSVSLLSLIGAKKEMLAQAIMLKVCNSPILSKQHAKLAENLCNVSTGFASIKMLWKLIVDRLSVENLNKQSACYVLPDYRIVVI